MFLIFISHGLYARKNRKRNSPQIIAIALLRCENVLLLSRCTSKKFLSGHLTWRVCALQKSGYSREDMPFWKPCACRATGWGSLTSSSRGFAKNKCFSHVMRAHAQINIIIPCSIDPDPQFFPLFSLLLLFVCYIFIRLRLFYSIVRRFFFSI